MHSECDHVHPRLPESPTISKASSSKSSRCDDTQDLRTLLTNQLSLLGVEAKVQSNHHRSDGAGLKIIPKSDHDYRTVLRILCSIAGYMAYEWEDAVPHLIQCRGVPVQLCQASE